MVVAVIAMRMVKVALDQVIRVIPVRHGFVTAPWAVMVAGGVRAALMLGRARRRMFIVHVQRVLVDVVLMDMV
jgi:hypothetical protein